MLFPFLIIFLAYAHMAWQVFGLTTIDDLDHSDAIEASLLPQPHAPDGFSLRNSVRRISFEKVIAAITLWFHEPTVLLLAPIQITFGVCAALLGYQVTGTIVKDTFDDYVIVGSLLSALVAFTAALLQVPFKHIAVKWGKLPLMLFGLVAFVCLSLLVLIFDNASLGQWHLLIPLYLLQGIGRACYEGTNKALYADFFPNSAAAAFSNIVLANGCASAIAYFTFPSLNKEPRAVAALVCATVALGSYLVAEAVQRLQKKTRSNPGDAQ